MCVCVFLCVHVFFYLHLQYYHPHVVYEQFSMSIIVLERHLVADLGKVHHMLSFLAGQGFHYTLKRNLFKYEMVTFVVATHYHYINHCLIFTKLPKKILIQNNINRGHKNHSKANCNLHCFNKITVFNLNSVYT